MPHVALTLANITSSTRVRLNLRGGQAERARRTAGAVLHASGGRAVLRIGGALRADPVRVRRGLRASVRGVVMRTLLEWIAAAFVVGVLVLAVTS